MVKSKLPDLFIPEVPLHHAVFSRFDEYGHRNALINGVTGERYTFRQVKDFCQRISASLRKCGVRKGDVFAICVANCPEFVLMLFGAIGAGATVTTINPAYTLYEMQKQIQDSQARYIFVSDDSADKAKSVRKKCTLVQKTFVIGQASDCVSFASLLVDNRAAFDPIEVKFNPKEDTVVLPYSSGTTGMPKGVMLTHHNLVANLIHCSHPVFAGSQTAREAPVDLAYLPFFHMYALSMIACVRLYGGATIVTLPRFKPDTFLAAIEKYKVTNIALVPPTVIFLLTYPLVKNYDLSSLETVACMAAPLSQHLAHEFEDRYKLKIGNGYGLSETGPTIAFTTKDRCKHGSVGILVSNTEVKVVDIDSKKVLGPNEKGELWLRGPQVMKGYLNNQKATREAIDEQGYFHSGDIGYYDEDENIYLVDRIKELIKYKGFQVVPAEIEALLLTHPKVDDAGVTGIPDAAAGEVPKAFIVKRPGTTVTGQELKTYVKDNLATYKQLRGGVEFVTEVPKSQTGKILRRKLKQLATKSKL